MTFAVFVDGDAVELLDDLSAPALARKAAMAINKTARDARAEFARRITAQVNLPASYVSPNKDRLYVDGLASPAHLETSIVARGRATSLARYVTANRGVNRPGVSVSVRRGRTNFLERAFLIRLRQGNSAVTDTQFNLGLAVRLRRGERLRNKFSARRVASGLYVLYGPSVAQVFENNAGSGTKKDYSEEIGRDLEREFLRLLGRDA